MTAWRWVSMFALLAIVLAGCKEADPALSKHASPAKKSNSDDTLQANLAKLGPADRKLVEAQAYCAVEKDSRLGSMGVPFKVMVKDQPVFVCCEHCQKAALKDPDKTIARVEELKRKSGS